MPLNEESGAIRINLRGREPNGVVEPGKEYRALEDDLREALWELRDVESGLPLVSEVLFTRDLVPKAADSPSMPDIFVTWNWTKRMDAVYSDRLGRIEMDFWPARTGDHHVDGFVLSNRPIAQGRNGRKRLGIGSRADDRHLAWHHASRRGRGSAFVETTAGETVAA